MTYNDKILTNNIRNHKKNNINLYQIILFVYTRQNPKPIHTDIKDKNALVVLLAK